MTSPVKIVPKAPDDQLAIFRAVSAPRGLTHEFASRLAADITSGKLTPGSRLPTEQEMIAASGVSRTVVREAVAALRAEGLVITRQGVGAFVGENVRRPFRIELDGEERSLKDVLEVMELRTGIEIEAASLAAERATAEEIVQIEIAFTEIDRAIARDESAVDQDFAFHCSIAGATGNPQFLRFLEYLGRFIIPRQTVRLTATPDQQRRRYLESIQKEHAAIFNAVKDHAVARAREAMRRHLLNSRKRYQKLAAALHQE
jgi:DNA-binding FadR family transcriptional regulator